MNRSRDDILAHVKKGIRSARMLSYGDTVIVGVSGGPDSTALLHILLALRHELGISVHVAHFNHGWRKGAEADENFVRKLARQWGVPCSCGRMPGHLAGLSGSREERGRWQRFAFFRRLAAKTRARAVALAHTQDDLVETVLMHIVRGTGLQGMRGMLPHREIRGIHLIRPLLGIQKRDILTYLRKRRIAYRKDPTNRRQDFLRNRLRLDLIPFLEKRYNVVIRAMLANLANIVVEDYDYIEGQARKVFARTGKILEGKKIVRFDRKVFLRSPKAIRRMLIRLAVERVQGNMNRLTLPHMRQIEDMISREMGKFHIHFPGGIRVAADSSRIEVFSSGK